MSGRALAAKEEEATTEGVGADSSSLLEVWLAFGRLAALAPASADDVCRPPLFCALPARATRLASLCSSLRSICLNAILTFIIASDLVHSIQYWSLCFPPNPASASTVADACLRNRPGRPGSTPVSYPLPDRTHCITSSAIRALAVLPPRLVTDVSVTAAAYSPRRVATRARKATLPQ